MRIVTLGAVLALLAAPAWARDLVVPEKLPAVTLAIPDTWKTTKNDDGDGLRAQSPDGDVAFFLEFGPRSGLDGMMKDNRDWMRRVKINANVKPSERTLDFGGTPGRVLRYDTRDESGKTLVDFVILEASRGRVVVLTLWGSADQRAANDADIARIMASVRIPAAAGGDGFWSGGPEAAKSAPEAAKPAPEAVKPAAPVAAAPAPVPAPAAPVAGATAPAPGPKAPAALSVRRALLVSRKAAGFGDVEARPSNAYVPGEKILSYIEPTGQTMLPVGEGRVRFGVAVGFEVRTPGGEVLGGQPAGPAEEFTADGEGVNYFLNHTLTLSGLSPGTYVLALTLKDAFGDRRAGVELPFTMLADPAAQAPAAAQAPPAARSAAQP